MIEKIIELNERIIELEAPNQLECWERKLQLLEGTLVNIDFIHNFLPSFEKSRVKPEHGKLLTVKGVWLTDYGNYHIVLASRTKPEIDVSFFLHPSRINKFLKALKEGLESELRKETLLSVIQNYDAILTVLQRYHCIFEEAIPSVAEEVAELIAHIVNENSEIDFTTDKHEVLSVYPNLTEEVRKVALKLNKICEG